jgi:hypothetical protein
MAGGSIAPIENSPPEIHTIPSGGGAEAAILLGVVGANATASAASVIGCIASTFLTGGERDERNTTKTTTAIAPANAGNTHGERLGADFVGARRKLAPFFGFMRIFARHTTSVVNLYRDATGRAP